VINAPNIFAAKERSEFAMSKHRNQPLVDPARRWGILVGIGAGAVMAAAVIGVSSAADAHADTGSDVLGQAGTDLTDATQVLDGAPTTSLDAEEATFLADQESLQTGAASSLLASQESIQSALPAADAQDFAGVDTQLTDAYQAILNADQAFVTADQAGDLGSVTGLMDQLGVVDADFAAIPAGFDLAATDIGAEVANLFGITDFLSF
jgi:hypothetical protein